MESHGALYPHIPRHLISHPKNASGNAVTQIVSDYMVCMAFVDTDVRVIFHCQHSDNLSILSFSDVAFSTPAPPTKELRQKIAKNFVRTISPNKFEESECAVCGRLSPMTTLMRPNVTSTF
jgi:hypothetical protein